VVRSRHALGVLCHVFGIVENDSLVCAAMQKENRIAKINVSQTNQQSMKKSKLIKVGLTLVSSFVLLFSAMPSFAGGGTGTDHGYFWSLYYSSGSASITFPAAGTYAGNFQITWSNNGDVIGGKGWNPGSAQTIGFNIGSLSGTYNNVSIYGWTTSPLIEYYICEKGSVSGGATFVNSVSSDGVNYNFYKHQQKNQPSIQGTATFWQYLDNWGGASTGQNYTVTTANHINNWKSHGGEGFGSYNYQILACEDFSGGSGTINATVW
jgi:endo-1,4-beta-xylanase